MNTIVYHTIRGHYLKTLLGRERATLRSAASKDPALEEGSHTIQLVHPQDYTPGTINTHSRYHTILTILTHVRCAVGIPSSLYIISIIIIIGFIGEFEIIDDHRSNKIVIERTIERVRCVISPRFDVPVHEIEKVGCAHLLPSL